MSSLYTWATKLSLLGERTRGRKAERGSGRALPEFTIQENVIIFLFSLLKLKSLECMSNSEVKHFVFQFKELCKDSIQTHSIGAFFNLTGILNYCSQQNTVRKCQHFKLIRTRQIIWKKSFKKVFILNFFEDKGQFVSYDWNFLCQGWVRHTEHQKATHSFLHTATGKRDKVNITLYFIVHV